MQTCLRIMDQTIDYLTSLFSAGVLILLPPHAPAPVFLGPSSTPVTISQALRVFNLPLPVWVAGILKPHIPVTMRCESKNDTKKNPVFRPKACQTKTPGPSNLLQALRKGTDGHVISLQPSQCHAPAVDGLGPRRCHLFTWLGPWFSTLRSSNFTPLYLYNKNS